MSKQIEPQREAVDLPLITSSVPIWVARVVVALVCFFNLTAAVPFVLNPAGHVYSFEVSGGGLGGEVLVRGLGIAFLMWQVPFLPVIRHPGRYRVCFLCLLGMQLVVKSSIRDSTYSILEHIFPLALSPFLGSHLLSDHVKV